MRRSRENDLHVPPVGRRSYWLEQALRTEGGGPRPPLVGSTQADVCIVGGGFAGLWTAYELTEREPSLDVVLLEADVCGRGGSGANGGFFSCSWHQLASLCHFFGEDEAVRYATALADQVTSLGEWCARHDAHVDYHHEGIVYGRADEWQPGPDEEGLRIMARHGLADRLHPVTAEEARRGGDSPRLLGGAFTPDLATVQPAKLARELRRVLLERGVRIFEATPMRQLHSRARPMVETPRGRVRAEQVVLTIGAWAASMPEYGRAFAVCTDFMVVTEPIPDLLAEIGWTSHTGLADSREMLYYLRRTDDDRIAIGGGGMGAVYGARIAGPAVTSRHLARMAAHGLVWLFPQLEGVRFAAAWSGPMDMTRPGVPFFTTLPGGTVHAGLGFSGHGLTPTRVGGKTLASLVLRADDEWSSLPVVGPPISRVPPEPLRWPLVQTMSWVLESGDRAQERGGPRGRLRGAVGRLFDAYSRRVPKATSKRSATQTGRSP
jgi:glycine/D-amino acid oxidase-like deaminating enzyme